LRTRGGWFSPKTQHPPNNKLPLFGFSGIELGTLAGNWAVQLARVEWLFHFRQWYAHEGVFKIEDHSGQNVAGRRGRKGKLGHKGGEITAMIEDGG